MGPNLRQQQAIKHIQGPLLIIAGPGSGKTFTLVERFFYLIQSKKLEPENLLVATFTEKAIGNCCPLIQSPERIS